jgi:hypothetical protein
VCDDIVHPPRAHTTRAHAGASDWALTLPRRATLLWRRRLIGRVLAGAAARRLRELRRIRIVIAGVPEALVATLVGHLPALAAVLRARVVALLVAMALSGVVFLL